jgi:hypothetical protein
VSWSTPQVARNSGPLGKAGVLKGVPKDRAGQDDGVELAPLPARIDPGGEVRQEGQIEGAPDERFGKAPRVGAHDAP